MGCCVCFFLSKPESTEGILWLIWGQGGEILRQILSQQSKAYHSEKEQGFPVIGTQQRTVLVVIA